jgi:hypothetical protein
MNEFKTETHDVNGGIQKIYRFPNGYGASVIRHLGSYGYEKGLWEVAVLNGAGELDYSTSITDDVLGRLNDPQVDNILGKISRL